MEIIKWRESYETGIPRMDKQHRQLLDLINKMYRIMRKVEVIGTVEAVLDEMAEYASNHLREEEDLLRANGYAEFDEHCASHQSYLDTLGELMAVWGKGDEEEEAVKEIYLFLRRWWLGHIVAEDRKYGDFLKSKGVR